MARPESSAYYNRIYIKILDIKTGNDLTSVSTITVEYNGTTYNTSKSSNGSNVYDINGFPNLTTSVSVICHADCEGYTPSNVQCDTIRNYNASLTPTTLSLYKEYPKTIAGQIERINDAKTNIKSALIDKGFTVSDTDKIDSYSKIIDQITSQFNQYNYKYNGVADDDGLKVIGWNDVDIAYFKYNNLHPKSESVGDTYKVSDANKQIVINNKSDIATYKNNTDFKYCPKFDTSVETSMRSMFYDCSSLTSIPQLDTSSVTDMYRMFSRCSSLTSIPQLDTRSVTDMSAMFYDCSSLTSIPQLDTSSVTDMSSMFYGCSSLTSIPQLDTRSVTDMGGMFNGCANLTSIPQLDTRSVTSMNSMFDSCKSLTSIPQLDTRSVTDMNTMFTGCSSLTSIPQLDTRSVTDMNTMFYGCSSLTSIPQLDTSSVTDMSYMFNGCKSLTSIPQLDTRSVTSMNSMFDSCSSLTSIPQLDTSSVTDMSYMFNGCKSLTTIPKLDVTSLTDTTTMFGYFSLDKFTTFGGLTNLKVDLDLSSCSKLTHDSLMNVFDEAGDVTSNPQTLTLGTTNLNKLTDEEKAIATNKGWILQ